MARIEPVVKDQQSSGTVKANQYSFEPRERKLNFLGRGIKKITGDNPLAIKIATFVLITLSFLGIALSMAAMTPGLAVGGLLVGLALLPVGLEADRLRRDHVGKELREKINKAFKISDETYVDKRKSADVKLDDVWGNFVWGKNKRREPFIVMKHTPKDGEPYLEAIYQQRPDEWKKMESWTCDRQGTFFSDYDKPLGKKDLEALQFTFSDK